MEVHILLRRPTCIPEGSRRNETRAQAEGRRHEAHVHYMFDRRPDGLYLPGPWLRYRKSARIPWQYCQPDGLFFIPSTGRILLIEAKLAHCSRAHYQLFTLYGPLIAHLFPPWTVIPLEICKFFFSLRDPKHDCVLRASPEAAQPGIFNVYVTSQHD